MAFADGQGVAFETCEDVKGNGADVLAAWFRLMRMTIGQAMALARCATIVRFGKLKELSKWANAKAFHDFLCEAQPIRIEAGFEGNPGVEGGAWRPSDGGGDGLVHLRFAPGTEDLPLHMHEFSDRLIVVTSGVGVFHYVPDVENAHEPESVMVEAGDAVLFARGVVHTFKAPISDLTLLSYHAPFIEFDDVRQFTVPTSSCKSRIVGLPRPVAPLAKFPDTLPSDSLVSRCHYA